jgi:indole-3-glycerol phosphate synthase
MTEVARILREIVDRRRETVRPSGEDWTLRHDLLAEDENPFLAALASRPGRAVIAEVKMGSPRIGSLVGRVDPEEQARLYRAHGAAALSVVVEPEFFHGSYELLARCREASGLPAIAKDFVVDPVQLRWAREAGASAVLLIAALHHAAELRRLAGLARGLGLVPLVETHDEGDLERLAGVAWELVGVNNRDLRTFEVDLARSEALAPRLPEGALRVAESGIGSGADVERLRRAGFDAFLVGESLLLADDPAAKLRELLSGAEEQGAVASPPHDPHRDLPEAVDGEGIEGLGG